jgi:hypothetical protein
MTFNDTDNTEAIWRQLPAALRTALRRSIGRLSALPGPKSLDYSPG